MILSITAIPEVGKEYAGKVTRITSFGAFIEIIPGQDGLLHISQMGDGYVRQVEDVMSIGDEVAVRVIEIDEQGRVDLTLANAPPSTESGSSDRGDSRERGDSRPQDNRSGRGRRDSRNARHSRSNDSRERRPPRIPKGRY
jgi:polyribonucleotide nucleotidyltransferase